MKNFEIIIGIENHVELKTNTKMFSKGKVSYAQTPNSMVNPTDIGYPGTLPTLNKKGVELAILACNALDMEIDPLLIFDRKNYFYPDLSKGFQITQQNFPIGKNGKLEIKLEDNKTKVIDIERLHIEEDTAKQIHNDQTTLIDYNRSGIGLIEIVTKPVLRSADEACLYVEKLREILLFLGVSDVKMNEGSLRTDLNISIRPIGTKTFSNKVEIKNMNSISNIKKAVAFEFERQKNIILKNEIVQQETRRWDDTKNQTISMRSKSDAIDYKYFTEPNIFPIKLEDSWIQKVINESPELADQKRIKYTKEYNLSEYDVNIILSSLELTTFFEETIKHTESYDKVSSYLISDIQSELNKQNIEIGDLKLSPQNFAKMINLITDGTISSKHAKTLLSIIMFSDKEEPLEIIERLNLKLISNPEVIQSMINNIISKNETLMLEIDTRPERIIKTLMGKLMQETGGNIEPNLANELILKTINKK